MKAFQRLFIGFLIITLLVLAVPATATRAAGTIYYVKANASGSNNGTSWANAYTDLQSAITSAGGGDEIWVAAGTYKPTSGTDRTISFKLRDGVALYGGFAGTEALRTQRNWTDNVTTLSGDIGTPNILKDNSYHVVDVSGVTSFLDGFTITKGNANGNTGTFARGGGILSERGRFHLENLIITRNYAISSGGGVMSDTTYDNATMIHVVLDSNTAGSGGGISNINSSFALSFVTFSNNTATLAGGGFENIGADGPSYPAFNNVIFINNTASDGGGVVNSSHIVDEDSSADASPSFTNVTFRGNSATHNGGAVFNYGFPYSAPKFTNVTFNGNSAENGGAINNQGPIGYPVLTNVTITGNTAKNSGGALYTAFAPITLRNVTVSDNTAADNCGVNTDSGLTTVENSIFWGNGNQFCPNAGNQHTIKNSVIQGGCPSGANCVGVVNADPVVKPLANNGGFTTTMALGAHSSAIDVGNDNCASTDQRGMSRPQGPACDAGAYEIAQATVTLSSEAVNDGWILSGRMEQMNSKATFFYVGDNEANRQYQSILSFNTAQLALPTGALISGVRLKLKAQSTIAQNLTAYYALGNLIFDIRKGAFSDNPALQLRDAQAIATKDNVGSISKVPVNGLYIKTWTKSIVPYIAITGRTQFRLHLSTTTNNDQTADALQFYSGEAAAADRPQLVVYYYVP